MSTWTELFSRDLFNLVSEYFAHHLLLTLAALAIGWSISLPLAVIATRVRQLEGPLTGFAGMIQTIPSLALLALMVPIIGTIGFWPALIALVLYSMLPVIRNTIAGLGSIDPRYVEAARAVGMTPTQRLFKVELPLAALTIIAGLRTSCVWTVGIATLATPVGQQSLGYLIFTGLQTRNNLMLLAGVAATVVLAFALDGIIRMMENGARYRSRRPVMAGLVGLVGLTGVGLAPLAAGVSSPNAATVVVGAKTFTEQHILAELLADRFLDADIRVVTKSGMNSAVLFDALATNAIDVYVDYSGTIWANVMKRPDVPDRQTLMVDMTRELKRRWGVVTVGRLGFENTYCLAMRKDHANELGIQSISDLRTKAAELSIAGDMEFFGRTEWTDLVKTYGLAFQEQRSMDAALMYSAVKQGAIDVITAYSSDGRIAAYNLLVLRDDQQVFPPYDAIVLFSPQAAQRAELLACVQPLMMAIDDELMRNTNKLVDVDGRSPGDAARQLWASIAGHVEPISQTDANLQIRPLEPVMADEPNAAEEPPAVEEQTKPAA